MLSDLYLKETDSWGCEKLYYIVVFMMEEFKKGMRIAMLLN